MVTSMKTISTFLPTSSIKNNSLSSLMRGIGSYFKVFFPGHFPMDKNAHGYYPFIISEEINSVLCPICGTNGFNLVNYSDVQCIHCKAILSNYGPTVGFKPIWIPKLKHKSYDDSTSTTGSCPR
jgi:hypothetical protein